MRCLKENVLSSVTETRLKVGFAEGATQFVIVPYWTVHFYMPYHMHHCSVLNSLLVLNEK